MNPRLQTKHPRSMTRVGAGLVVIGELVALFTQVEPRPESFLLFIFGGGTLIAVGALLGIWGVASSRYE